MKPRSEDEVSFAKAKIEEFPRRQQIIALLTSTASSVDSSSQEVSSSKQSFNHFPLSEKERVVAMLTQHLSTEAYGRIRSTDNAAADDDVSFFRAPLKRADLSA